MNKLEDKISDFNYYKERFAEWEASEIIIDEKRAIWMLKDPKDRFKRICLFRDEHNMYIYGDYGSFSFNSMTWLGSVYNLQFDNEAYQTEKMDRSSREALMVFDESALEEDVLSWTEQTIRDLHDLKDNEIEKTLQFIRDRNRACNWQEEFCEDNDLPELEDLLEFVLEGLRSSDEMEWISFLRDSSLDDYDEACESRLWDAGKRIDQRYFINMYGLKVCGEKLKAAEKGETVNAESDTE